MKKLMIFLAAALMSVVVMSSCKKDDEKVDYSAKIAGVYETKVSYSLDEGVNYSDPQDSDISIAKEADGKISLSLKDFDSPVGKFDINVKGIGVDGKVAVTTLNGKDEIIIPEIDEEKKIEINLSGTVTGDALALNLTINVPGATPVKVLVKAIGTRKLEK